jgi:hypothetical protein
MSGLSSPLIELLRTGFRGAADKAGLVRRLFKDK